MYVRSIGHNVSGYLDVYGSATWVSLQKIHKALGSTLLDFTELNFEYGSKAEGRTSWALREIF